MSTNRTLPSVNTKMLEVIDRHKIEMIICDFDGVLTDNKVHTAQNGEEIVVCSRSDGLAFDTLRKIGLKSFIFSTEVNSVVLARARKLKIPVIQGVKDKRKSLLNFAREKNINLDNVLYVGNDLNDFFSMGLCGYRACPSDADLQIKSISNVHLQVEGGKGVIRAIVEQIFQIDIIKVLYEEK